MVQDSGHANANVQSTRLRSCMWNAADVWYVSNGAYDQEVARWRVPTESDALTPTPRDIIEAMKELRGDRAIAQRFGCGLSTVTHVRWKNGIPPNGKRGNPEGWRLNGRRQREKQCP